jgi:hypothetical protein
MAIGASAATLLGSGITGSVGKRREVVEFEEFILELIKAVELSATTGTDIEILATSPYC